MRNPDFCLCENNGAEQLYSNCIADQNLCFRCTDSTIPLLILKFQATFYACIAQFVLDLFENHIVGFLITLIIYLYNCGYSTFTQVQSYKIKHLIPKEIACPMIS